MPCQIPDALTGKRHIQGLLVGCISVFVYLYTLVFFDYIETVEKTKYVDWDVKTITAGDYTVEIDLEAETFNHWKQNYFDETNLMSESAQFKYFLRRELEQRVQAVANQGYENETPDELLKIRVSHI